MIVVIIAFLLIAAAVIFAFREKTTVQNVEKKVSYDLILQQDKFEREFIRILFEQKLYMTLIVNFDNYFVQYLFDNKVNDFGIYCESISETYYDKHKIEQKPSIAELIKLDFSLSQEFMPTENYNKVYRIKDDYQKRLILQELYLIMNKVYHVSKSTPVTLHYF